MALRNTLPVHGREREKNESFLDAGNNSINTTAIQNEIWFCWNERLCRIKYCDGESAMHFQDWFLRTLCHNYLATTMTTEFTAPSNQNGIIIHSNIAYRISDYACFFN